MAMMDTLYVRRIIINSENIKELNETIYTKSHTVYVILCVYVKFFFECSDSETPFYSSGIITVNITCMDDMGYPVVASY